MSKYEVATSITAYQIYIVDADSEAEAKSKVEKAFTSDGDPERILDTFFPNGFGDDEVVIDVEEIK